MPDPFGSPTFAEIVEREIGQFSQQPQPMNRFAAQPVLAGRDLGLGDLLSLLALLPGGLTQQALMQAAAGGFETSVERAESAFPRKVIGGGGPGEFVASIGKAKKLSNVAKEAVQKAMPRRTRRTARVEFVEDFPDTTRGEFDIKTGTIRLSRKKFSRMSKQERAAIALHEQTHGVHRGGAIDDFPDYWKKLDDHAPVKMWAQDRVQVGSRDNWEEAIAELYSSSAYSDGFVSYFDPRMGGNRTAPLPPEIVEFLHRIESIIRGHHGRTVGFASRSR